MQVNQDDDVTKPVQPCYHLQREIPKQTKQLFPPAFLHEQSKPFNFWITVAAAVSFCNRRSDIFYLDFKSHNSVQWKGLLFV